MALMTTTPPPAAPPDGTAAPYRCPACGDTSVAPGTCARCEVPMLPSARVGERLAVRSVNYELDGWRLVGILGGMLVAPWLLVQLARALAVRMTVADVTSLVYGSAVLFGMLGFILAGVVARRVHATREALAARFARWTAPQIPAASARDDARVKLRGTVAVRRVVSSPVGQSCAAFELRNRAADWLGEQTITGGGEFALDDGSGVPVRVLADQCVVVTGARTGRERVVTDGATVEVVGVARWTAASPDERTTCLRGVSPRVLELAGSAEQPLLIHVVQSVPEQPPVPVRVAPADTLVRVASDGRAPESCVASPAAAAPARNARRND